ncbi:hypothetical protein F5B22DRAFT_643400 [Xylaria bambusicola]|uniref:uncharacterized protein n=1 Tax=Xylaria bambusicola TaxID=326684 RepID=UPI00200795DF|nr:uncharacterized protein F5B22DRAFT_643400 [Xylaria bambusicola]KAI0521812.1 hypothetical protein F5B22DRAFT_643400 [Xylaria bambusicola]
MVPIPWNWHTPGRNDVAQVLLGVASYTPHQFITVPSDDASSQASVAPMTSFAFNTLIGQVNEIAVNAVKWKYFLLFAIANFTNAIFIHLILPETKQLPLEEMNYLFTHESWIIARVDLQKYTAHLAADVERRAAGIRKKDEL